MALNGRQFHEMSRGEFESQPGTYFHGPGQQRLF